MVPRPLQKLSGDSTFRRVYTHGFPYCCNMCSCFSHFFSTIHHLHSCTLVTIKWNTCIKLALQLVLSLTFPVYPSQSMLMALMVLLGSVPLAAIKMSQATLFLMVHRRWVLFHSSFTFLASLNLYPNTIFFQFSLPYKSMRSSFGLWWTLS